MESKKPKELMKFAQRLKEWRKTHVVAQKELGEMLGITRYAIGRYESFKNFPSCEIAQRLSEVAGIDVPGNRLYNHYLDEPITEEERQFATAHYGLVNAFLRKKDTQMMNGGTFQQSDTLKGLRNGLRVVICTFIRSQQ